MRSLSFRFLMVRAAPLAMTLLAPKIPLVAK